MTPNDIKQGMIVELSTYEKGMVLGDYIFLYHSLVNKEPYKLSEFNNEMIYQKNENIYIRKIWSIKNLKTNIASFNDIMYNPDEHLELIWDRDNNVYTYNPSERFYDTKIEVYAGTPDNKSFVKTVIVDISPYKESHVESSDWDGTYKFYGDPDKSLNAGNMILFANKLYLIKTVESWSFGLTGIIKPIEL